MATNKSVFSNLIWRFMERCGAQLVTFIVSIVLARLLDPVVYGTVALVTVIITLLQVFVDSGLGNALIQKKDADDIDFSTVFYFNIGICLVLYAGLFFLAPLIAKFYGIAELTPVIRVLGLTLIISGIKNVQQAYVSRHLMFKKFFFSTIGGTIGAAAVGIALAVLGYGVWALVAQYLINLFVGTVILWFTVKWRPKLVYSWKRWKGLFSFGWKLLVSALIDTVYQEIRQLIIGKKYSSTDLAYYNQGKKIPNFVVTNINSSIDSVLLPAMSERQDNKMQVRLMTRRAIKTSSYLMWPLMVGLAVCAEPFVRLLLTEKWLFCVPFLRIFCFSYAFWPIHTANLNAIKAMGRSDMFLKLEIVKKVVGVALIFATMWHSVMAMAYSLLISTILSSFINAYPNKKLLGYSYLSQVKDILPAIALSAVMGGAVYCVNFIGLHDIITLVIQVVLGAGIYIFGSWLFKLESFGYLLSIVKGFLRKRGKTSSKSSEQTAKQPSIDEIEKFLNAVDKEFPVPLSQKTDLHEYAIKLYEHATIFFVEQDGKIAAMVAGYTDNVENNMAYISLLATKKEYRGQGYAKRLVNEFLECAKNKNLSATHLYAVETNERAVQLYYKLGFEKYMPEIEPRKDDLHLIFRVKKDKKI